MSDNIPLNTQRACTLCADGELYNLDVFSYVQPPVFGTEGSLNQLIIHVTRTIANSDRLAFIQEQITQGMIEVFSNSFHWKKTQGVKLIAKLVMGDLKCKVQVDRKKIDEMKLGENFVITLPSCTTSSMKGDNITLMNENKENLLEIKDLYVRLFMIPKILASTPDQVDFVKRATGCCQIEVQLTPDKLEPPLTLTSRLKARPGLQWNTSIIPGSQQSKT